MHMSDERKRNHENSIDCSDENEVINITTRQKQWQLYALGYYAGAIDGIFGAQSRAATIAFQTKSNLAADGIFGAKTAAESEKQLRTIQLALNRHNGAGLTVDGLAGVKTMSAIAEFQKKHDLAADGIAGERTRAKLDDLRRHENCDFNAIKYFKQSEFACPCGRESCGGFPVLMKKGIVEAADDIRAHFGFPVRVSSGVRCFEHNAEVGGVPTSRHLTGQAIDLCCDGVSADALLRYAVSLPEITYAYKIDDNYIHIDMR